MCPKNVTRCSLPARTETDRECVVFPLLIGSQRISSARPPETALGLNTQSEQCAGRRARTALLAALPMIPSAITNHTHGRWWTAGLQPVSGINRFDPIRIGGGRQGAAGGSGARTSPWFMTQEGLSMLTCPDLLVSVCMYVCVWCVCASASARERGGVVLSVGTKCSCVVMNPWSFWPRGYVHVVPHDETAIIKPWSNTRSFIFIALLDKQ